MAVEEPSIRGVFDDVHSELGIAILAFCRDLLVVKPFSQFNHFISFDSVDHATECLWNDSSFRVVKLRVKGVRCECPTTRIRIDHDYVVQSTNLIIASILC